MSKNKPPKKKVVVTSSSKNTGNQKKKAKSTVSKRRSSAFAPKAAPLVFGKQTYIWIGIGAALVFVGMLLMSGGAMPSPEVWDDNIIYGFRRTVLAPIVILAGLGTVIYAILKK